MSSARAGRWGRGVGAIWRTMIRRLSADFLAHDLAELNWQAGVRNALGIMLPLVGGLLFNEVPTAIVMSVGAIVTGFAGLSGTWQKRMRVMLWAIVWVSVTTFVGGLTGRVIWLAVMCLVISGGLAGMFVAVAPELATIGTLATNAMIVFSGLSLPPAGAWSLGLKVLAGGTLQLLLMLAVVPWQPQADGTRSLRRVVWAMAQYAANPTRTQDLKVAQALVMAEGRIGDPAIQETKRRRLARWLARLDTARNDMVTLYSLMAFGDSRLPGRDRTELAKGLTQMLKALGHDISRDPDFLAAKSELEQWGRAIGRLHSEVETEWDRAVVARAVHLADTLERMVGSDDRAMENALDPALWTLPHVRNMAETIARNVSWDSSAFRHAVRIMATLATAVAVAHLLALPRGYWVPLTALVILKADFFSTIGRGLARVVGTALGVVLATGLVILAAGHAIWGLVAMVAFGMAMYTVLNFNYTLFSVMVTGEIVLLLSFFERVAPMVAMEDRLVATVIGSLLALGAFVIFPTWQRHNAVTTLADLVEKERAYLDAIVNDESPWMRRRETRLARTGAAASLESALSEPTRVGLNRISALRLLQSLHELADVLLTMELLGRCEIGEMAALARASSVQLERIETALRSHRRQEAFDLADFAPPSLSDLSLPVRSVAEPLVHTLEALDHTVRRMGRQSPKSS